MAISFEIIQSKLSGFELFWFSTREEQIKMLNHFLDTNHIEGAAFKSLVEYCNSLQGERKVYMKTLLDDIYRNSK